jgi:hypothetical protein
MQHDTIIGAIHQRALKRFFMGWIRICQGFLRDGYVRLRRHSLALDRFWRALIFAFVTIDGAPQKIVNNFLK